MATAVSKYTVARLDGYGGISAYLRVDANKFHHWGDKSSASKMTHKQALGKAVKLMRESKLSAYTVVEIR
jgi:hypothetical protein